MSRRFQTQLIEMIVINVLFIKSSVLNLKLPLLSYGTYSRNETDVQNRKPLGAGLKICAAIILLWDELEHQAILHDISTQPNKCCWIGLFDHNLFVQDLDQTLFVLDSNFTVTIL